MIGSILAFALKPKSLIGIGLAFALISAGFVIRKEIKDYGKAQYEQGETDTLAAVAKKAAEAKAAVEAAQDAGAEESAKTETVYVEVIKEVVVSDATVITENEALKYQLDLLYERIENAPIDNSTCAREPVPAVSVSVHGDIDRLLSTD